MRLRAGQATAFQPPQRPGRDGGRIKTAKVSAVDGASLFRIQKFVVAARCAAMEDLLSRAPSSGTTPKLSDGYTRSPLMIVSFFFSRNDDSFVLRTS